ncbi:MAG: methylornithine synthase PylB [Desulfobacteraceae bacterium]|nr:methylornithine synthase PylB [Desulfobacteraceae bacterium]
MKGIGLKSGFQLDTILGRSLDGELPGEGELRFLLELTDPGDIGRLFQTARQLRGRYFGDRVFLYGFLYFSTHCRNNCLFCQFRRDNAALERSRKTPAETVSTARLIAGSGVHLIDLTMGEDPFYLERGEDGLAELAGLVRNVRLETGLPVMISPGVIHERAAERLAAAGADWYACYQETYSRVLFDGLRHGQSFGERLAAKRTARAFGLLVEEGLLCGAGETSGELAASVCAMRPLDPDQVRAMTYVPQRGTVLPRPSGSDRRRELQLLAVLRLVFPDRLIPASLDVEGLAGLGPRLAAGANVVTSLVPPGRGLGGVANASLDIGDARRTPEAIAPVLAGCGLHAAGLRDYLEWMKRRRGQGHDAPAVESTCG